MVTGCSMNSAAMRALAVGSMAHESARATELALSRLGDAMTPKHKQAVQAAGAAVVAAPLLRPEAASARGSDGKETGAFAADSYKKYQKGYPRNIAPIVSAAMLSQNAAALCGHNGNGFRESNCELRS